MNAKTIKAKPAHGQVIRFAGEAWTVLGVGATHEGKTYLHLASQERFTAQKNGQRPIQSGVWLAPDQYETLEGETNHA